MEEEEEEVAQREDDAHDQDVAELLDVILAHVRDAVMGEERCAKDVGYGKAEQDATQTGFDGLDVHQADYAENGGEEATTIYEQSNEVMTLKTARHCAFRSFL